MTLKTYRDIAAEVLGRPLKQDEVVHHIDGDRKNNKRENLLICDNIYHRILHGKINKQKLTIRTRRMRAKKEINRLLRRLVKNEIKQLLEG